MYLPLKVVIRTFTCGLGNQEYIYRLQVMDYLEKPVSKEAIQKLQQKVTGPVLQGR